MSKDDRTEFEKLFDSSTRATRVADEESPWDRIVSAQAAGTAVPATLRARGGAGWSVDVFGVSGFLADDAIDPEYRAQTITWHGGLAVSLHVLSYDRGTGELRLCYLPARPHSRCSAAIPCTKPIPRPRR